MDDSPTLLTRRSMATGLCFVEASLDLRHLRFKAIRDRAQIFSVSRL
jgi:hypothetical protein